MPGKASVLLSALRPLTSSSGTERVAPPNTLERVIRLLQECPSGYEEEDLVNQSYAAINNIAGARGLAASGPNVLTMTRHLSQ